MVSEKFCLQCGAALPARNPRGGKPRMYCNGKCRDTFFNKRRHEVPPSYPRACVACGTEFVAKRSDHRFCTPSCVRRAYDQRRRARAR